MRADLVRIKKDEISSEIIPFVDSVLAGKGLSRLELKMGDKVKIYSLENVEGLAEKTVTIVGYVKNPGQYPLYSGLNVSELLFLSGGINDDQWSNNLYKDRLDIIRLNQKTNEKKIIQTEYSSYFE